MKKRNSKLRILLSVSAILFTATPVLAEQLSAKDGMTNITLYKKSGGNFDRKDAVAADKFNAGNTGRLNDNSGEKQGFIATKLGGEIVWVRVSQLKDVKIVVNCPRSAGLGSSGNLVITSGAGAGEGCK